MSASGYSAQSASRTRSPPRIPVSQSWISAARILPVANARMNVVPVSAGGGSARCAYFLIDLARARDRSRPGEVAGAGDPLAPQLCGERGIAQHPRDPLDDRFDVVR